MTGIRREHLLTMRVTTSERKAIRKLAQVLNCGVSEAIRTAVNLELARRSPHAVRDTGPVSDGGHVRRSPGAHPA